jgi:hypothetical protein
MSIGTEIGGRIETAAPVAAAKTKRKVSAYNRRYKTAFKRIAPRHKLKSGKWKAGGFKRAVREAHRMAKKK